MTGVVYLRGGGAGAGRSLHISGDIGLVQKQPLSYRGRDERYLASPLDTDQPLDVARLLRDYGARNVSLRLENEYAVWSRGAGLDEFMLEVNINYPAHVVRYTPGFWQVIKWGWIQYLAILVLFIYMFNGIKTYVFAQQILPTIPSVPWKQ